MRVHIQRLINWRTAAGELVIVIAGVLIALAVDSCWDARQERAQEAEYLSALRVEAEENLSELRGAIARMDTIKLNTLALIKVLEGIDPTPAPDSLVAWTWMAFSFAAYEPLSTVYNDLVSNGGIGLIRDEGLKHELALFKAKVERLRRLDWVLDQWNRIIQPWAIANLQLDYLAPAYREEHGVPEPHGATDWDAVLMDQEFKGIIINRLIAITDYSGGLLDILPAAEAAIRRLGHATGDEAS